MDQMATIKVQVKGRSEGILTSKHRSSKYSIEPHTALSGHAHLPLRQPRRAMVELKYNSFHKPESALIYESAYREKRDWSGQKKHCIQRCSTFRTYFQREAENGDMILDGRSCNAGLGWDYAGNADRQ
jgi:hypothetical protein